MQRGTPDEVRMVCRFVRGAARAWLSWFMATKGVGQNDLWQRAAAFAAFKHRNQIRKDGRTPYISHPFRVAMTVRHEFGCEDAAVLTAALLHDTIEDTTTDYDDVERQFGETVADLVAALTKNTSLPEAKREAQYDAQLAAADWRARLIKLADTYDNLIDAIALGGDSDLISDSRDKGRRAIALAGVDSAQSATARGIAKVTALIASSSDREGHRAKD